MAKKEITEPKDVNAIVANVHDDERELEKREEEKRPGADQQIGIYAKRVAASKSNYEDFLENGWHESPESLLSTWPKHQDTRDFDLQCFHHADAMIETYTMWRRAKSFDVAPTKQEIAALEAKIKAGWMEVSNLLDEKADYPVSFLHPPREFLWPAIFLGWDQATHTCQHHHRFVELVARSQRNESANKTLIDTYQTLDEEKSRLSHHLRMMESSQFNSREDVEDVRRQIAEVDEQRRAAQLHREEQSNGLAGSTALFGTCLQFLRDRGINGRDPKFLLLGKRRTVKPFVDPLAEGYRQRRAQQR